MRSAFLDDLVAVFAKRSKAIRYSGRTLALHCTPSTKLPSLSVDVRHREGVWIGLIFDANAFAEITIQQRRKNQPLRRLAKVGRIHIVPDAEMDVAICEETFLLTYHRNENDEWWRTQGQHILESLWLKLGT